MTIWNFLVILPSLVIAGLSLRLSAKQRKQDKFRLVEVLNQNDEVVFAVQRLTYGLFKDSWYTLDTKDNLAEANTLYRYRLSRLLKEVDKKSSVTAEDLFHRTISTSDEVIFYNTLYKKEIENANK